MKNKIILCLLVASTFIGCKKDAGLGGSANIAVFPEHHGKNIPNSTAYIKFNSKEKVKLVEFEDTEFKKLGDRSPEWICSNLKKRSTITLSMARCYEYFEAYKMRKRILKLIKNNIV